MMCFFFKQKTAYERRISDWSSDVCSSDLSEAGFKAVEGVLPKALSRQEEPTLALFQVPHEKTTARAPKQFVDLQNDVTAAAIELATRAGFESVEHVKRYTAQIGRAHV